MTPQERVAGLLGALAKVRGDDADTRMAAEQVAALTPESLPAEVARALGNGATVIGAYVSELVAEAACAGGIVVEGIDPNLATQDEIAALLRELAPYLRLSSHGLELVAQIITERMGAPCVGDLGSDSTKDGPR